MGFNSGFKGLNHYPEATIQNYVCFNNTIIQYIVEHLYKFRTEIFEQ